MMFRKASKKRLALGVFSLVLAFGILPMVFSDAPASSEKVSLSPPVIPLPVSSQIQLSSSSGKIIKRRVDETCGNRLIDIGEQCDDGNQRDDDGCSSICLKESSTSTESLSTAVCGNGVQESGEACDDGNALEGDGCNASCQQDEICTSDTQCNDGNACNGLESCSNGSCVSGMALSCSEDGNPCTSHACNPSSGCVTTYNNFPCTDGNACTVNDTCSNGNCSGPPMQCGSNYQCQAGQCTCLQPVLSGSASKTDVEVGETATVTWTVSCGTSGEEEAEAWTETFVQLFSMPHAFAADETTAAVSSESTGFMLSHEESEPSFETDSYGSLPSTSPDSFYGGMTSPSSSPFLGVSSYGSSSDSSSETASGIYSSPEMESSSESYYGSWKFTTEAHIGQDDLGENITAGNVTVEIAGDLLSIENVGTSSVDVKCMQPGPLNVTMSNSMGELSGSLQLTINCRCPSSSPIWDNTACVGCSGGKEPDGSGGCRCPAETLEDEQGICRSCPEGQKINNGECVRICAAPTPYFAPDGTCEACPADRPTYVEATNTCEAECTTSSQCTNDDPCISERSCDPAAGKCVYKMKERCACTDVTQCVDGDPCTTESCVDGMCKTVPANRCLKTCEDASLITNGSGLFCPEAKTATFTNDITKEKKILKCFSDQSCPASSSPNADACSECVQTTSLKCDAGKTATCYQCAAAAWTKTANEACVSGGFASEKLGGVCPGASLGTSDEFGNSCENQTSVKREKRCDAGGGSGGGALSPKPGLSDPVTSENVTCCKWSTIATGTCTPTSCSGEAVETCTACSASCATGEYYGISRVCTETTQTSLDSEGNPVSTTSLSGTGCLN